MTEKSDAKDDTLIKKELDQLSDVFYTILKKIDNYIVEHLKENTIDWTLIINIMI